MPRARLFAPLVAFLILPAAARSIPDYWEEFKRAYNPAPGSELAAAQCRTCHAPQGPPRRNPYGTAVGRVVEGAPKKALTAAMLRSLEQEDSDGDGARNGEEIRKGSLPGSAPAPGQAPELIPKHSFHPTVVHFPIALFLFGALLEVLGARRRSEPMRQAGFWNTTAGTAATVLAVPTGFAAALRSGFDLRPGSEAFLHLGLAAGATLLMLAVTVWRRKGAHTGLGYFAALLAAAALVGVAGHFGGMLVY